jgi:hypothetical protein
MIRNIPLALLLPLVAFWGIGCALVASETVYIQNAEVTAPAGHLPVRIAQDVQPGVLTLSPSVTIGSRTTTDARIPTHSPVNATGSYSVDTVTGTDGRMSYRPGANPYDFAGTNLTWSTPSFTAMVSADYTFTKAVALEGGVCFASMPGKDIWGGHVGLGFMSEGELFGIRLSGGVQWTPISYLVETAVETQYEYVFFSARETITTFYRDRGTAAPFGWYAGLTLNTRVRDWPLQPFINATLSKERFFSFEPSNTVLLGSSEAYSHNSIDSWAEASAVLVLLSPGVSIQVGPSQRLLIGARWTLAPDMVNADNSAMPTRTWFASFVQLDFGL